MVTEDRPERREDRFGYELHRLVADFLLERGDEIREIGFRNLARMKEIPGADLRQKWLAEWDLLLHSSDAVLAVGMLRLDELGNDIGSMTPFAGVLTQSQRPHALSRARQDPVKEERPQP